MTATALSSRARSLGATPRALLLGIVLTAITDLWIHWAELIMSGAQGHTAIAATSTPVGAVCWLFVLAAINTLLRAVLPGLAFSGAELLVVYAMLTTATVLSSSGQLHFLVPTVTAAWHYATDANAWSGTFHRFVPDWLAQKDPTALDGFYKGRTAVPWALWLKPMAAWTTFVLLLSLASLCLVAILRRQWVDRERLAFPTVALPLALMEDDAPLLRAPLFWLGALIPLAFCTMNTIATNIPSVPLVSLRADTDIATFFPDAPFNAMGRTAISFYPFVLGLAYFIPVEVTFSAWFFFLLTRVENVVGAWLNIDAGMTGTQQATFPFIGQQGAGAFLALSLVSLWLSRSYLKDAFRTATGERVLDDSDEPLSYRVAFLGLGLAILGMIAFCVAAGMQPIVAVGLIFLALCSMIAATRIRAETGNAWLFGPEVDVNHLMTRTLGTGLLTPQDLTALAYLRPVVGNFDMRCLPMPHQFEALKMADAVGASRRRLFGAILLGTAIGFVVTFSIALMIWHGYGAEAKTDAWRTGQGRVPFDNLVSLLRNPVAADGRGIVAIGFGFAVTAGLMALRTVLPWWPLHAVGYAMANTNTMSSTWLPFLLAWGIKTLVLRYGGAAYYRKTVPFFLGLIGGDLLGGGLTTAIGALTGINVYPINW
jgi:hypothetical protein